MTTIVFRDGVLAADSQVTVGDDAGNHKHKCRKLFRKFEGTPQEAIIATAGDSGAGLLFVQWYGSGDEPPEAMKNGNFNCLVLSAAGIFEYDQHCIADPIDDDYYAIGTGAAAALGALCCGVSAREAVEIAAEIDIYTGGDIVTMELTSGR